MLQVLTYVLGTDYCNIWQAPAEQAGPGQTDPDCDRGSTHREGICLLGSTSSPHWNEQGPHVTIHRVCGRSTASSPGLRQALPCQKPFRLDGDHLPTVRLPPMLPAVSQGISSQLLYASCAVHKPDLTAASVVLY